MDAVLIYIDNWLGSSRIETMDAEQERGYFRLLLHAAKSDDCGLPNDPARLAKLSKLNGKWKSKSGPIMECFHEVDGRLFNQRLLEGWEKWKRDQSKRSEAGKAGNRVRWGSQGDRKRIANGSQLTPKLKLNSSLEANTASNEPLALPPQQYGDWPESAKAVHEFFPDCDLFFIERLVNASGQTFTSVDKPKCEFSDGLVADAVRKTYKMGQRSAGLFGRMVPACIRTWATEGRPGQNNDGEVHY